MEGGAVSRLSCRHRRRFCPLCCRARRDVVGNGAGRRAARGRPRRRWGRAGWNAATDRARGDAAPWLCRGRPGATACPATGGAASGFPAHGAPRADQRAAPGIDPHHCRRAGRGARWHLASGSAAQRPASPRCRRAGQGSRRHLASWGASSHPAAACCRRDDRGSRSYLAGRGVAPGPTPLHRRPPGRDAGDPARLPPLHRYRASRDDAAPPSQGGPPGQPRRAGSADDDAASREPAPGAGWPRSRQTSAAATMIRNISVGIQP